MASNEDSDNSDKGAPNVKTPLLSDSENKKTNFAESNKKLERSRLTLLIYSCAKNYLTSSTKLKKIVIVCSRIYIEPFAIIPLDLMDFKY